jgi:hypothetical protein
VPSRVPMLVAFRRARVLADHREHPAPAIPARFRVPGQPPRRAEWAISEEM